MVRPTSWLPLAVLALLVGLTLWLNQLVQAPLARADGKQRHDPDLMVEMRLQIGRARHHDDVRFALVARRGRAHLGVLEDENARRRALDQAAGQGDVLAVLGRRARRR